MRTPLKLLPSFEKFVASASHVSRTARLAPPTPRAECVRDGAHLEDPREFAEVITERQADARVLLRRLPPVVAPKADHRGVDERLRTDRHRPTTEDRRDAANVPAAQVAHRHLPAILRHAEHSHES